MKQAVILLLHKDIDMAFGLIDYFQGCCDIFVHVDKDFELSFCDLARIKEKPGVVGVYQKYKVNWGGFSILKTEIFMLKQAMKLSNFRYVHLLSGQDMPIKPLSCFLEKFDNSTEDYFIHVHLPHPQWEDNTMTRIRNIFFMDHNPVKKDADVAPKWAFAEKLAKMGLRFNVPNSFPHIYGGSQWFSLTRNAIEALLKYTSKHPWLYFRMRFAYVPDEVYIPTVLMNIDYEGKKVSDGNLRMINWPPHNSQHPLPFEEKDFVDIANSDAFFARKFDEKSASLRKKIWKYLLSECIPIYDNGVRKQNNLVGYDWDEGMAAYIVHMSKLMSVKNAIDLGCGPGYYVRYMRANKILARGFDGNPWVEELSSIIMPGTKCPCQQLFLHDVIESENVTDLALLISVGEYIPKKYQDIVIDNICKITKKYLIVNWANSNECDTNIVNPLKSDELERIIEARGFEKDILATDSLRCSAFDEKHKNALVFKKIA